MLSCPLRQILTLYLNVAAESETHQTRQRFSNLLLSNFGEPVRIVAYIYIYKQKYTKRNSSISLVVVQEPG